MPVLCTLRCMYYEITGLFFRLFFYIFCLRGKTKIRSYLPICTVYIMPISDVKFIVLYKYCRLAYLLHVIVIKYFKDPKNRVKQR